MVPYLYTLCDLKPLFRKRQEEPTYFPQLSFSVGISLETLYTEPRCRMPYQQQFIFTRLLINPNTHPSHPD